MSRKISTVVVALMASLIASAALASGAQAGNFQATSYPATVAGSQISGLHEFSTGKYNFKCESATLGGTLTESSSTLTVTPEYSKCAATFTLEKTWINAAATVKTNGCTYTYHDQTTDSKTVSTGSTTINCPAGKQIEYSIYEALATESHVGKPLWCTFGVAPQGPLSGITYTNNPEAKVTDVQIGTALKVVFTKVAGTLVVCGPIAGATYLGTTTQTAKNGKGESISLSAG